MQPEEELKEKGCVNNDSLDALVRVWGRGGRGNPFLAQI